MTKIRIRVNEAELLRAGWPRDAVNALRGIIAVVASGIEVGNVGDLETLLLTATDARRANDALRQEIQLVQEQIQAMRREMTLIKHQDTSLPASTPNLSEIMNRLKDLEALIHGAH